MPRYLTKSRFKLAQECPTKLFYTGKREVYADQGSEDSFLKVLADGGFQVGELAKLYHPGGQEVLEMDHAEALAKTEVLLQRHETVLYEPAVSFENLFIRIDVLVKEGNRVDLIEVKAKSCDGGGTSQFLTKKGQIKSEWRTYLEDVAFQKHVLEQARPDLDVRAFLMLVDKRCTCPGEGLHQKFRLDMSDKGRRCVTVTTELTQAELDEPILRKIDVDDIAAQILQADNHGSEGGLPFGDYVRELAASYEADVKIPSEIGSKCTKCQFKTGKEEITRGLQSGFEECWRARLGWTEEQIRTPTVLDLGYSRKKDDYLAEGKASLLDLEREDLDFDGIAGETIRMQERQWLQVQAARAETPEPTLRKEGLRAQMQSWQFPLHFIDFETSAPAIPLHAGQHPYDNLVFQYSHHLVHEDGSVEHAGQHIEKGVGAFPNFGFVRALRDELAGDQGSIFRYSHHENTMLASIHAQLHESKERDRRELMAFIESISHPTSSSRSWPVPERDMIDLCALVKDYYFDPAMGGSVSIKKVLPAVLDSSTWLQARYSQPIYGAPGGIPSLNFTDQTWVQRDADGHVRDPYELLPPLFADTDLADDERLISNDDSLREGSAAMAAYTRMQFAEMSPAERAALQQGLLRYCELDTLAMVMIYEAWREWCKPD